MRRAQALWIMLAFAIGMSVGALAMWVFGPVRVRVVTGYAVVVNAPQDAIGFAPKPDAVGESYSLADTFWQDVDGVWHTHAPITCLNPNTLPSLIRMGVVDVPPTGQAPGTRIAVWLECPIRDSQR